MKTIYRLADDADRIARIQKATVSTTDFGIVETHGLLGSKEWWAKIASGELPRQTLSGTITKVYTGSMGYVRLWPKGATEPFKLT